VWGMQRKKPDTQDKSTDVEAKINQINEKKKQRKRVTLLFHPRKTVKTFIYVLRENATLAVDYLRYHRRLMAIMIALFIFGSILYVTPGDHQPHVDTLEDFVLLCVWWIGLGVLSSIGLGTGLHTFVLYLGPYIAKVTLTATECGSINFNTHGPGSFVCPEGEDAVSVTYWEILRKVQFEAFLWGLGTAIGELPPYFVARAARLSGMRVQDAEEDNDNTPLDKIRRFLPSIVTNLGFFGILLFASIPNPLFDLAGITCGHFLVPFWKFFGATMIGKAVIKAHIQTVFVITAFHKEHLDWLITKLEALIPTLHGVVRPILEKERARLHRVDNTETVTSKSGLQLVWDFVLISMLAYFLISIINSSVQEYLMKKDDEKIEHLKGQGQILETSREKYK